MEQLNKKLSKTSMVLLTLLVLLGLGLLYYFVIYTPTKEKLEELKKQQDTVQTSIDALTIQAQLLANMKTELGELKKVNKPIARYDNQKAILASLSNILNSTLDFEVLVEIAEKEDVAAGEPEPTDKNIVRKQVNLRFLSSGYQQVKKIVTSLKSYGYRAQIQGFDLLSKKIDEEGGNTEEGDISIDMIDGTISIVFYETLK